MSKVTISLTVFLIKDTDTKLHVAGESGKERWLSKSRLRAFKIKDEEVTVTVTLDRAHLLKGLHPPPVRKQRVCLSCRQPFLATADFRVCPDCKTDPVWRTNNPYDA